MRALLPRDAILDLWAKGLTAPEIANRLRIARVSSIGELVSRARKEGDARAGARVRNPRSRPVVPKAPAPIAGRVSVELGIEVVSRTVVNSGQGPGLYSLVSLPRLRCLEDA
jgi:hypothetical protein